MYRLVADLRHWPHADGWQSKSEHDIPVLFDSRDEALAGAALILKNYPGVELRLHMGVELVLGERQLRVSGDMEN